MIAPGPRRLAEAEQADSHTLDDTAQTRPGGDGAGALLIVLAVAVILLLAAVVFGGIAAWQALAPLLAAPPVVP